ncbi:MAG TPA: hypothetical protein VFN35_20005 [Ktedonobacteraceae bacterium]|nr:hypothetical protein [Ktedonobacteraceae bacterium]
MQSIRAGLIELRNAARAQGFEADLSSGHIELFPPADPNGEEFTGSWPASDERAECKFARCMAHPHLPCWFCLLQVAKKKRLCFSTLSWLPCSLCSLVKLLHFRSRGERSNDKRRKQKHMSVPSPEQWYESVLATWDICSGNWPVVHDEGIVLALF